MGGVVKKMFKSVTRAVLNTPGKVSMPKVPDYEAERKKAEDAAHRKRNYLAVEGMGGTVLGGSYDRGGELKTKKLFGE